MVESRYDFGHQLVVIKTSMLQTGSRVTTPPLLTVTHSTNASVTGVSISDLYAAANPGSMNITVKAVTGTIAMQDSTGAAISSSGTNRISYSGTFSKINAALATLTYTAPGSIGTDIVSVRPTDQKGISNTGFTHITVN